MAPAPGPESNPAPGHDDSSRLERLWEEYGEFLAGWDDITLARWMSQTLSQLNGRVWRQSHPLIGMYRLAAVAANKRGSRIYRLAQFPHDYSEAECCGAPLLPFVTRDVVTEGLLCPHCNAQAVPVMDLAPELQNLFTEWAAEYDKAHMVAHWSEKEKNSHPDYDKAFNQAAQKAEDLHKVLALQILPRLLEHFPAVLWEDHDSCLDVMADDIELD